MVRYVGDGKSILWGVPNRDLTAEEWAKLPLERQEAALDCGLWVIDEEPQTLGVSMTETIAASDEESET